MTANREANYHEMTELPAWTRAVWDGPGDDRKLVNEADDYKWSGDNPPPPIGAKIPKIYMNNLGSGKVVGYFCEYGWLGVLVTLDKPPKWWVDNMKDRGLPKTAPAHLFGIDLEPRKKTTKEKEAEEAAAKAENLAAYDKACEHERWSSD